MRGGRVTEEADGTATVAYRAPSAVFAPYRNGALDEMAKELGCRIPEHRP